MPINRLYRIVVFGPTGAGKSQFCNFCQKDLDNNTNEVSGSLNSCTQEPKSNIFKRSEIDIELIDTAGSNDSDNNDIKNLQKVCDFLKIKEQIDYIILLLNYDDRLQSDTKDYIKTLGNIFTPKEFYTHFCIIFTHTPLKESKKNQETKEKHKKEIIIIINEIFNIPEENNNLPEIKVYFINTEIIFDNLGYKQFDANSQITVDKMIEQIKLDVGEYPPIDTTNLEITGKSEKIRQEEQEKEIKELEEKLKQEEIRKKKEEEEKIKLMKIIEEKKKLEEIQRQKEEELKEIKRRQEEELRRLEQIRLEEERRERENRRREEAIRTISYNSDSENKRDFCIFF